MGLGLQKYGTSSIWVRLCLAPPSKAGGCFRYSVARATAAAATCAACLLTSVAFSYLALSKAISSLGFAAAPTYQDLRGIMAFREGAITRVTLILAGAV